MRGCWRCYCEQFMALRSVGDARSFSIYNMSIIINTFYVDACKMVALPKFLVPAKA